MTGSFGFSSKTSSHPLRGFVERPASVLPSAAKGGGLTAFRSNNRRFSAWSRFRTGLSCSSDRRFHQISLPSRCSACKLLNRLYFLCGLIVLISFLSANKNGSLFSFRLPQRSFAAFRISLSADCKEGDFPDLYVRLLNSYS